MPLAGSIIYLSAPHFGIGAGIGAIDAALVPLLATLADEKTESTDTTDVSSYGNTFALGQTAVSLAYCLGKEDELNVCKLKQFRFHSGPMLGGFLVELIGFPKLMLSMGILNLMYSPFIFILRPNKQTEPTETTSLTTFAATRAGYHRFENEEPDATSPNENIK